MLDSPHTVSHNLMSMISLQLWHRLPILYVYLGIGASLFVRSNEGKSFSLKALFQYWFPKRLFLTKDTRDHTIMLFLYPITLFFMLSACPQLGRNYSYQGFFSHIQHYLGTHIHRGILGEPSQIEIFLFFILLFLVGDFSKYVCHYLTHKIPFLWHFHQVHHTTTVLTPLAGVCLHPVDTQIFLGVPKTILQGLLFGIFLYLFTEPDLLVKPALVYFFTDIIVRHIFTAMLHMEYRFPFPAFLHRIVMTANLHQVHHSNAPQHLNKNFSMGLAIWDHLFGTIYIPEPDEPMTYGLPYGEKRQLDNPFKMIFYPFVYCFNDFAQFIWSLGKHFTYSHSSQE
jgi:sterol desaturase/sphingolipid hydroxylase (fatty acid hydroxylase superfamily)